MPAPVDDRDDEDDEPAWMKDLGNDVDELPPTWRQKLSLLWKWYVVARERERRARIREQIKREWRAHLVKLAKDTGIVLGALVALWQVWPTLSRFLRYVFGLHG